MESENIQTILEMVEKKATEINKELLKIDGCQPNSIVAQKTSSCIKAVERIQRFSNDIRGETDKEIYDSKIKEMTKTPDGRKKLKEFLEAQENTN